MIAGISALGVGCALFFHLRAYTNILLDITSLGLGLYNSMRPVLNQKPQLLEDQEDFTLKPETL